MASSSIRLLPLIKTWSIFAQHEQDLSDAMTVFLGGRYYNVQSDLDSYVTTPPFGLLVYTVKSSIQEIDPDVSIITLFKSSTPYWIIMLIAMVIIINFPEVATWLPNQLF